MTETVNKLKSLASVIAFSSNCSSSQLTRAVSSPILLVDRIILFVSCEAAHTYM